MISIVINMEGERLLYLHIIILVAVNLPYVESEDPPLYFSREPECGSAVSETGVKILTCQSYSDPVPEYRWLREGKYVSEESFSGTFRMYHINRTAAGTYRCQASNRLGSIISDSCRVDVAYLDPLPISQDEDVNVGRGGGVKISLPPFKSYPFPPTVEWRLNSNIMADEGQNHQVTLSKDLVLLDSQNIDDGKQFQADILNGLNGQTSTTQTYTVRVSGGSSSVDPAVVVGPKDTTASQGEYTVNFECVINASPISFLSTKWYRVRDGSETEISQNPKYLLSGGYHRILTIKSPETSDTGLYRCKASMSNSNLSPPVILDANLTVYESPVIISQIETQYVRDFSQNITIHCQGQGTPAPTMLWYFNSQLLQSSHKLTVFPNGTLSITFLDMTESGVYMCFARNEAGETKKATWIKVNSSPPEIINKPVNLTITEGSNARLPCEATGAPKPTVSWKRIVSNSPVDIVSGGRIQILDNGQLLITTTVSTDSGQYVCNASNSRGSQSAEAFLEVYVKTVITRPPTNTSIIKGSSSSLQCGVSKDPNVQVSWHWFLTPPETATSTEITNSPRHTVSTQDGTLTITGVYNVDIGWYKCQVTSKGGNDSSSAFLQVTELPHKPVVTSVVHNPSNLRSVNVSWSPGFDGNSPIQRFILQYRKVDYIPDKGIVEIDPWNVFNSNVPPSSRSIIVSGLRPARYFQVIISAVNSVGEGSSSDAKPMPPIRMPEQAPSSPPKGFYGTPRSNSSIMLLWQAPSEDTWNGDLRGYMIRYKLTNYPDSTYQSVNTTNPLVTTHELTNLIIFQSYEFQIAAYNNEGVGVFSNTIEERTMEGQPTRPPKNVQVVARNSTVVRVAWQPVDAAYINGVALGYKIKARRQGQSTFEKELSVPPNPNDPIGEQSLYINGLKKFTYYSVVVLCYTGAGDGPASLPMSVRTEEDVPGKVATLHFEDILDTSLKVVWTPPTEVNGNLLGYTLKWEQKIRNITKEVNLNEGTTSYTIRNLMPTTNYTIYLYARTAKGNGAVSSADIESGVPPERPKPPEQLGVSDVQPRSVVIQFFPGYDGKTSITNWVVEAQVGSDENWREIYRVSAPEATSITVHNLSPYTQYRMRIIAVNIVAPSEPSEPTRQFQTSQDSPNVPPGEVTLRAVNATALRISWAPLSSQDWNGQPKGYRILYREDNGTVWKSVNLTLDRDFFILSRLEEWMVYEVKMQSFNDVGYSDFSPIQRERTRDARPSSGPASVECKRNSSTSIGCTWGDVPYLHQNGIISGYKVLYKDMSSSSFEPDVLTVVGNETKSVLIGNLRKYVIYQIQVLAYTRMGDGELSQPPVSQQTLDDVPGPPVRLWFPEVTSNTVKIMWSPPLEPNGIITGYMVTYRRDDLSITFNSSVIVASQLEYYISSLVNNKYYSFSVMAKTRRGWGSAASAKVYTTVTRRVPDSPTKPTIMSDIRARSLTISWLSGFDGYGPLRNYTIQFKKRGGMWTYIPDSPLANVTSFTIRNLHPNTVYIFRVAANNDVGSSNFSAASDEVTTLQDKPEGAPENVVVVPLTRESLNVSWQHPPPSTWNGDILGYIIQYRQQSMSSYQDKTVPYQTTWTLLENLVKFTTYDIRVSAFNSIGDGPHSAPHSIYVGDAAPSAPPLRVNVTAKNATALNVFWDPPPLDTQNGKLSGYKMIYWKSDTPSEIGTPTVVPEKEMVINGLENYSKYTVRVLAYNTAGDGPYSPPLFGRTKQWKPGKPRSLDFFNITMTSLNVTWEPPLNPNGIIKFYGLTYKSHADNRVVTLSDLPGNQTYYWVDKLEENVTYTFTVVAKTIVGPGPEMENSIKTGPQKESPEPPRKPSVQVSKGQVHLKWVNGNPGSSPIIGYYIQVRTETPWKTVQYKYSSEPSTTLSWPSDCVFSGQCQFSVVAFNSKSISYPSPPTKVVSSQVSSLQDERPFHYEWWFPVIVALGAVVVILVIVSLLCLVARNSKDLKKSPSQSMSTALEPFEPEEGGFATTEIRQSRRSLARIGNGTLRSQHSRGPPRPSPASVTYSEDEGAKGPLPDSDDDGSSSTTEKPSNLGDSTEPSDNESDITEKHSSFHPPSSPPPPPFRIRNGSNHPYINDPVSQSWQQNMQQHTNFNAYTYTDSEADSSHYAMSFNGGQVILNNAAGSRAPLPGFSSFV
ncbi:protein sidekick-2-like isoform X2 [Ostrea edulis]|uniref:protein sidekick-2-like isoform X2 n=1 Tax=Ostrea edulis TaxID=37623 RepID=UPI0024AF7F49|nr:protein sidekick-2-like isoform X2 [Ostrea edulis]